MIKAARYAIWVVIVHALVSALHGAAHARLDVSLSQAQTLFVVVVITVAPLLAGLLLWRKQHIAGALLFLCSMVGALVFGVYNHFVASSPDHVAHVAAASSGGWVAVFQVTAALLAVVEAVGCVVGGWMLKLYSGSRAGQPE
ncbi:MAG: hypothetical protein WCF57_09115 [Pyrinomonadaceae bacterium]